MADPQRARKMADRIKEIVARRLDKRPRDPRLGFVTITDVRVTGDLQHASIFYTVYGTDEERADSAAALKSATGMLRTEVGKNITARLTPSLEFIPDALPENARRTSSDLLAQARMRDLQANAGAVGASTPATPTRTSSRARSTRTTQRTRTAPRRPPTRRAPDTRRDTRERPSPPGGGRSRVRGDTARTRWPRPGSVRGSR